MGCGLAVRHLHGCQSSVERQGARDRGHGLSVCWKGQLWAREVPDTDRRCCWDARLSVWCERLCHVHESILACGSWGRNGPAAWPPGLF